MVTDSDLIQRVLAGERQMFSELVRRHQKSLLRLSLRFTRNLQSAEEVVQESFIRAFEKLEHFEGRSSFKSWLFQIAVNTAKNRLRKTNLELTNAGSLEVGVVTGLENRLICDDLSQQLKRQIDNLPHRQKTALILRVFEELSFKEIAEIMDCPYDTAKANYRHALMSLKSRMECDPQWIGFLREISDVEMSTSWIPTVHTTPEVNK